MKAFSMDNDLVICLIDLHAHFSETVDGGQTVGPFQKVRDFCRSKGDRAKHNGTVGDGFVSWNINFAPQSGGRSDSLNAHKRYT